MLFCRVATAGLVSAAGQGSCAAAETIPLRVTPPIGVTAETELPLYVGLPLPATPSINEQNVRLLDGARREVPLQTELLATWTKEGASRWLGLHFVGRADGNYRIEAGDGVQRTAEPPRQLKIDDAADGLTIDTGAATFVLPKTGPLFSRVALGTKTVVENRDGYLLVADQHGTQADEPRGDANETPQIEVRGPL